MRTSPLNLLLAVAFIIGSVSSQNAEELPIPVETDNQFPPEHSESDGFIEGSGDGVVEEPAVEITTESIVIPKIQHSEVPILTNEHVSDSTALKCPKPCVCNVEGDTTNYVVDCSGYGLTEFPAPIDPKTTTLKLHNNKLTEIPKSVSDLKQLKFLNAKDNLIMDLALGSVSELPELEKLDLANNRLIEYPRDLKNSLSLTKLKYLDLSGNDMRTILSSEMFSNFKELYTLILPQSASEYVLDLCHALKNTRVCTETCENISLDCLEEPGVPEDDLFNATLPGMISVRTFVQETNENSDKKLEESGTEKVIDSPPIPKAPDTSSASKEHSQDNEFSLRKAINNEPTEKVAIQNVITDKPTEEATSPADVKIGAKTADTKGGGGVDKSVIGVIVAGMIIVVAIITIKKNWSSIRKRFSSTPRPNDRSGANANGTTPEEVPLQDKSPA